jgi:hypothetical protein
MRAARIPPITLTAISRRNCTIQATSFTENCPKDSIRYPPDGFKVSATVIAHGLGEIAGGHQDLGEH